MPGQNEPAHVFWADQGAAAKAHTQSQDKIAARDIQLGDVLEPAEKAKPPIRWQADERMDELGVNWARTPRKPSAGMKAAFIPFVIAPVFLFNE